MNISLIQGRSLESLVTTFQTSKCNDCYEAIYNRVFPKLYSYCLKLSNNTDDAYDIAMEAFMRAVEKIHLLRQAAFFSTWLFRIAHNIFVDKVRISKRQKVISIDEYPDIILNTPNQEDNVDQEVLIKKMNLILEKVKPESKNILISKYIYGYTIDEIKNELGITASATKMRLLRARKAVTIAS